MADLILVSEAELEAEKAQKLPAFAGLSLRHFRGQIAEALKHFGSFKLLEEYTKHDITHIDAMLAMYEWMIPKETKELMTPADWLLITLSTYLHDFGLLVTRDEFDARLTLATYQNFKSRILDKENPTTKDYRSQVQRLESDDAERFMYQEFVRYYHAERIEAWLRGTPELKWGADPRVVERLNQLLCEVEETFREDVGLVCESHHLDDMHDIRKYRLSKPYGSSAAEEANVQYAAFLLRTADLLHVTKDRVPSMAALIINPRNPKSQIEWAKQRAVRRVRPKPVEKNLETGEESVQADTVEVHAKFKDAEGYFGLTGYLQYAVKQLQQTFAWSKENQATGSSQYLFPWRRIDTSNIEAHGFVTEQFVFSIDQAKILDLLTGHTLYNDTGVVVRELVQNSLDAVRLQAHIATGSKAAYRPRIDVNWNSQDRTLTVTDNGVGMSQIIIERNFLRVGSSRYQEPEFRKEYPEFTSISRFGIGVLSTFMVADDVTVSTVHESEPEARKLSLRDVHGQYLVRLIDKRNDEVPAAIREHGTSVTMTLRPSADLKDIETILRGWIVLPGCEVQLTIDEGEAKRVGFNSVEEALLESLTKADLVSSEDGVLKTRYGALLEIRPVVVDGLDMAYAVSWNEWLQDWGYVLTDSMYRNHTQSKAALFGVCIGGVRVTTQPPGFVHGGIAALANATGETAPRTNVARSAIEKTDEYELMLERIYAAYVGHITTEMRELEQNRASSLTRAVQEASYLAEDLAHVQAESPEIRDKKLRTVPGMLIENDGVRKAYSLEELTEFDELASIESNTIASFEGVLRSVRGATSPSLKNLIDAMGSDEVLPRGPLVCGISSTGLINKMFATEWEVARLETDDAGRTLKASWRRKESSPLWIAPQQSSSLRTSLTSRLERDFALGRADSMIEKTFFPSRPDDIELVGFGKKEIVLCQGWLFLLPGHPLLEIKSVAQDVPEHERLWCVSWLIGLIGLRSPGTARHPDRNFEGRRDSGQWLSAALDNVRSSGLFEVLDEDSVREILVSADLDPLDVLRWDKRQLSA